MARRRRPPPPRRNEDVPGWLTECWVEDWLTAEELSGDGWRTGSTEDNEPGTRWMRLSLTAWLRWSRARRAWIAEHPEHTESELPDVTSQRWRTSPWLDKAGGR